MWPPSDIQSIPLKPMWVEYNMSEGRVLGDEVIGPDHEALANHCTDFDFNSEFGGSWQVLNSE